MFIPSGLKDAFLRRHLVKFSKYSLNLLNKCPQIFRGPENLLHLRDLHTHSSDAQGGFRCHFGVHLTSFAPYRTEDFSELCFCPQFHLWPTSLSQVLPLGAPKEADVSLPVSVHLILCPSMKKLFGTSVDGCELTVLWIYLVLVLSSEC